MAKYIASIVIACLTFMYATLLCAEPAKNVTFEEAYELVRLFKKAGKPQEQSFVISVERFGTVAIMYSIRNQGTMPAFTIGLAIPEAYAPPEGEPKNCTMLMHHEYVSGHQGRFVHRYQISSIENCLPKENLQAIVDSGKIDAVLTTVVRHLLGEYRNPSL